MAVSDKLLSYKTVVTPACTLTSLANGAGRNSATIDNTSTRALRGRVFVRTKGSATAPTSGAPIKVYLIARSNDGTTDLASSAVPTGDAAVTTEPLFARCLGTFNAPSATANLTYEGDFDVPFDLPAKFSICIWNAQGASASLSATSTDHIVQFTPFTEENQ